MLSTFDIAKALRGEVHSWYLFSKLGAWSAPNFIPTLQSKGPTARTQRKRAARPLKGATKQREWTSSDVNFFNNWVREQRALKKQERAKEQGHLTPGSIQVIKSTVVNHVVKVREGLVIPAKPSTGFLIVVAEKPCETPASPELKWAWGMLKSIGGLGYLWTLSQADRNRLTHALNGNIEFSFNFKANIALSFLGIINGLPGLVYPGFIFTFNFILMTIANSVPKSFSLESLMRITYHLTGQEQITELIQINPLTFFQEVIVAMLLVNLFVNEGIAPLFRNRWLGGIIAGIVFFIYCNAIIYWLFFITWINSTIAFFMFFGAFVFDFFFYGSLFLGCLMFQFLFFYFICKLTFIFLALIEIFSSLPQTRMNQNLLMSAVTAVNIFTTFIQFVSGEHIVDPEILANLCTFSETNWRFWYVPMFVYACRWLLYLPGILLGFTLLPFRYLYRSILTFVRRTASFYNSFSLGTMIYGWITGDDVGLFSEKVTFFILLPLLILLHLTNNNFHLEHTMGKEIDKVYTYLRGRLIAATLAFLIVFPIALLSPVVVSIIFWLFWPFIIFIISSFFFICIFPSSVPDALSTFIMLWVPFIYNATFTVTPVLRQALTLGRNKLSTSFMQAYIEFWCDAGSVLGQCREVHYRYMGQLKIFTARMDLLASRAETVEIFYAIIRRNNVAYMDLILLGGSFYLLFTIIANGIKACFHTTVKVVDALLTAAKVALLVLFIPQPVVDFCIVNFHLACNHLYFYYRTLDFSPTLSLDFSTFWVYARFVRSILRHFILQTWFTLHYITHDDIEEDSETQSQIDDLGKTKLSSAYKATRVNLLRSGIKRLLFKLEDFKLPEFIQAQYESPTPKSIRETYKTLRDLGFPVDQEFIDSIQRPGDDKFLDEWADLKAHIIAATDFKFNIPRFKVEVAEEIRELGFPEIPGYIHTTTYTNEAAELNSTNRYYTQNHTRTMMMDDFNDIIDAAWDHVKVQYANSKLSSPSFIYKHWVKKYNLGFGFRVKKKNGGWRQMRRAEAIEKMGGRKSFLRAWASVFKLAAGMVGVAPVFTKMESLKVKKFLNKQVRTVVGSAFTHSVLTYIFNFKPNHNYKPWENSSKVGMPINGLSFARLFASLQKHDAVWAGDMTAFDSSIPPVVARIVRELRKLGYQHHSDSKRLYELIDIAYEQLIHQPMGFKSMGTIFAKEQGFTTGHTSTTPDNTLALLVVYLFAWRRVTGLRAREFFNFNTLANFGDDHVLGYDRVFGWSPEKAAEAMKELGIIMRDEGEGQNCLPTSRDDDNGRHLKITFLAKQPLWISGSVLDDLRLAGVTEPLPFAVCHDRARLIGKIKAQTRRGDPIYKRTRLISFIQLTAHHRDVYDSLRSALHRLDTRNEKVFARSGIKLQPVPDYKDVVRNWYSGSYEASTLIEEITDGLSEEERVFSLYEHATPIDYLLRWFSDIPTVLSPRYTNTRWADWMQTKAASYLNWPLSFVAFANGVQLDRPVLMDLLQRTPYSFLRAQNITAYTPNTNPTTLYIRHFLYMFYYLYIKSFFRAGLTILDLMRSFDHAAVNLYFILFGKVVPVLVEVDLHILDTIVLVLLSFVHIPHIPQIEIFIKHFNPEAPSMFIGRVLSMIIQKISPNGSVDMQPFYAMLDNLRVDDTVVVDAPTGTGKSTRMVDLIQRHVGGRVIVIQPRHLLVVGVTAYMNAIFPHTGIGGSTEGLDFSDDDRIVYCTPQSFFMSSRLRDPHSLIIVDEAHVNEPAYIMLDRYLQTGHYRSLYMTATPLPHWQYPVLRIPAVNAFSSMVVETDCANINDYLSKVTRHANSRGPSEKTLIFVTSQRDAQTLAERIVVPTCILSSKDKVVDPFATVYIATSVADAGLTIPDVSIVHSMDIGISVSMLDVFRRPEIDHFRLPATTKRQRVGRTGRTNNGVVFWYHVLSDNILDEQPNFSPLDYINSLSQSITMLYPLMPLTIQRGVANLLPQVAGLESPESFYTLTELTYTEHDAIFALNSRELLKALSPSFLRGFRDILDGFETGFGAIFDLPFEDIGLPANPPSESSDDSSIPDFVTPSARATAAQGFNASRFAQPGPQPSTNYDDDPVPQLRLNAVGVKYFYGIKPSTADLGPAHIDADYPDLDEDSSEESSDDEPDSPSRPPYRPQGYRPGDGHVDAAGRPHAYRPFETPRAVSPTEHLHLLDRVIGTRRMRFGGTIVAQADVSDLGPASLDIDPAPSQPFDIQANNAAVRETLPPWEDLDSGEASLAMARQLEEVEQYEESSSDDDD